MLLSLTVSVAIGLMLAKRAEQSGLPDRNTERSILRGDRRTGDKFLYLGNILLVGGETDQEDVVSPRPCCLVYQGKLVRLHNASLVFIGHGK